MNADYPTCVTCGRQMRPWRARVADHPGTVPQSSATECNACRSRARRNGTAEPSKRGPRTRFQMSGTHIPASDVEHSAIAPVDGTTRRAAAVTVARFVPRDEVRGVLLMLGLAEGTAS